MVATGPGLGPPLVRNALGLGAIATVVGIYLVGVLLPLTQAAFLDVRYRVAVSGAPLSAFVIIPVGTVLAEEVAFRSVLWGMLARHATAWRVSLTGLGARAVVTGLTSHRLMAAPRR